MNAFSAKHTLRGKPCGAAPRRLARGLGLAIVALIGWERACVAAEVIPVAGESFSAALIAVDATWQVTLETDAEQKRLPAAGLVRWGHPAEVDQAAQIVMAGGGIIAVSELEILRADQDRLSVQSLNYGSLSLPIDRLAAVIFKPPADPAQRLELIDRLLATDDETDRALLVNGDVITGIMKRMNARTVAFDAKVGPVDLDRRQLVALAFNPALINPPRHTGLRSLVGLEDGTRVIAESMTLNQAKAEIHLTDKLTLEAAPESVVWLQPLGGRCVYLSDLEPLGYRHIPFLELAWNYRRDRNAGGGPLACGDRQVAKGLGMHSASRITYAVEKGARRFRARVGVDDSTEKRGSVTFRVYVDGDLRYSSPMVRGGDHPLDVSVEVAGARRLSLLVHFGDRGDELDYADWLDARFER